MQGSTSKSLFRHREPLAGRVQVPDGRLSAKVVDHILRPPAMNEAGVLNPQLTSDETYLSRSGFHEFASAG